MAKRVSRKRLKFDPVKDLELSVKQLPADVKAGLWWEIPVAILTWIIPASLFKLGGWGGFATSFLSTWLVGGALNNKNIKSAAFMIGGVHLTYTLATQPLRDHLGLEIWRMSNQSQPLTTTTTATSVKGLAAYLQPDTLTDNGNAYRKVTSNSQMSEYLTPKQANLSEYITDMNVPSKQTTFGSHQGIGTGKKMNSRSITAN